MLDHHEAALESARHLARLVCPDGRFIYKYDAFLGTIDGGYNVVRHAGCAWLLGIASSEWNQDHELREASARATRWLSVNSMIPTTKNGLGVVERGCVKLGANALTVLAIFALPTRTQSDLVIALRLCDHIWGQQLPSGNFAHKWDAATGRQLQFVSAYYTGQALFASLVASAAAGDKDQFDRARSTLTAFVCDGYGISQQSHWMMYAVQECDRRIPTSALHPYVERLIDDILTNVTYRARQNCTPVACRTEALLIYLSMPFAKCRSQSVRVAAARKAIADNLVLQLGARLPNGAFRKSANSNEIRIDYIQHNVLSLLNYSRLRENGIPGNFPD